MEEKRSPPTSFSKARKTLILKLVKYSPRKKTKLQTTISHEKTWKNP